MKRKSYRAALETLTEFLKQNPDSKYAANAQYSIGEAHYALGQFKQARDAFFKVPASEIRRWRMAAASLVHVYRGKFFAFDDISFLLDNYPQSEEVVKARDMLREWGNENNPYVGRKGSLSNLPNVTLTINSNDILMKCANPEWKVLKPSDVCQKQVGLCLCKPNKLRSMVLDMFRRKLPSVVL